MRLPLFMLALACVPAVSKAPPDRPTPSLDLPPRFQGAPDLAAPDDVFAFEGGYSADSNSGPPRKASQRKQRKRARRAGR